MNFRLVVLDVDGTLLDPSGVVSARVRDAVRAAHERGCLVTLASGRRLWAIRPIVEALGIAVPVILYNGAVVYDLAGDQALLTAYLGIEPLRCAIELMWQAGFQPVVYETPRLGERVFAGPPERDNAATAHYFDRPTIQPLRMAQESLSRIVEPLELIAMGDEGELRGLRGELDRRALDCRTLVERQSFVPRSTWWQLNVTAPASSKGDALRRLCALTGVPLHETLAIGDGINDLELIESAGLGVAMGNAVAELKRAAGAIVPDNAHAGAAEALERFVLGGSDSVDRFSGAPRE